MDADGIRRQRTGPFITVRALSAPQANGRFYFGTPSRISVPSSAATN
jgi:hypothetical protein